MKTLLLSSNGSTARALEPRPYDGPAWLATCTFRGLAGSSKNATDVVITTPTRPPGVM